MDWFKSLNRRTCIIAHFRVKKICELLEAGADLENPNLEEKKHEKINTISFDNDLSENYFRAGGGGEELVLSHTVSFMVNKID